MSKVRKQNIFNTLLAAFKFLMFWVFVLFHFPIVLLLPTGRFSVHYFRFFMQTVLLVSGVKVKVIGNLISDRPLMLVANHISIFEIGTFPVALGNSFFAKKEIEKYPLIGWFSKKFGVIFVDRSPSKALMVVKQIESQMNKVDYPMVIYPEGTTTNGSHVKPFKSAMFSFAEGMDIPIQPLVMNYRYHDGSVIKDEDMANHFAYFANETQIHGPKCQRERSIFSQLFHIMVLGGFLVEITVLPVPDLKGKDRKEMAEILHKIVSDKYMELKDKQNENK